MPNSVKSWSGELVGTFIFVLVLAGSVILSPAIGLLGVAIAHAFALAAVGTTFGAISGGHFNPGVTLSAWIGGRIKSSDALGYVGSQILGALAAGLTLRIIFTEAQWGPSNLGSASLSVSDGRGILIEAIFTFVLVMVVWGTAMDDRAPRNGALFIGLVLGGIILVSAPLTGGAVNFARYLGTAAVAGELGGWWVYLLGNAIGGIAAGFLFQGLFLSGFTWKRGGPTAPLAEPAVEAPAASMATRTTTTRRKAPARKPAARRKPATRRR